MLPASIWLVTFVISGAVLWSVVKRAWVTEPELAGRESSAVAASQPCTKAVILARGLGARMRSTDDGATLDPEQAAAADAGHKAMMPVGRPFLDYVLSGLADAGFREVCIVVAPDDPVIRARYGRDAIPERTRVSFATQASPLGTADALLSVEEFAAGEPFVVLNADNYYPVAVLSRLRMADGAAGVAFTRNGLVRDGGIPPERIAKFAILDIDATGRLRRIAEKPDAATMSQVSDDTRISMNCWRLTSVIFRACRDVPASPRGELELPLAIQFAIDVLGLRVSMIDADASVMDLSSRGDVAAVAARLRPVQVRL